MNIKILKWEESDIENLVRYANNKKISDNLAEAFPFLYYKKFGLEFNNRVPNEKPTKIFAIIFENNVIGSKGILPDKDIYRKNASIAYFRNVLRMGSLHFRELFE